MKVLDVPTMNLTDMKRHPREAFETARKAGTGVYIFGYNQPIGVVLTKAQYERLFKTIENLEMKLMEYELKVQDDFDLPPDTYNI